MKSLTYDQWKAAGFFVRKGEKSKERNKKGEALFTRAQVEDDWDKANGLSFEATAHLSNNQ